MSIIKITLEMGNKKSVVHLNSDYAIMAFTDSHNFTGTYKDARTEKEFRVVDSLLLPLGFKQRDINYWVEEQNKHKQNN